MRFSFDELYGTETPELCDEDEYSIIGSDDEDIPRLRVPKCNNSGFKTGLYALDDQLDENLQELLANLDLSAKLPGPGKVRYSRKINSMGANTMTPEVFKKPATTTVEDRGLGLTELQNKVTKEILRKVEALQQSNDKQVQIVRTEKQRVLEEQRREAQRQRELELEKERQQEEEERRKRQHEEEQRKQDQEKQKQAEFKAKQEQEERERQEKLAAEQEAAAAQQRAREEAVKGKGITNFAAIHTSFKHYKNQIKHIKTEVVEVVKKDANLKSILSKHKRKINPKFGQLTNSEQHLQSIILELRSLVDQTKPNNLGYQWILNFIAKALVSQAETEVRVKPESAVPLAKLALNLLVHYPELLELLMARFVKKCPFVIGYSCSIESEAGRYNMGWRRSRDDAWEDETSYDERMGGIVTLFATITRLPLPAELIQTHKHPLPISHSWQLVARVANTAPELLSNTHFVVLGSWWDAAAAQLLQAFAGQAHKLLVLIATDLTGSVAERRYVGAARLRILFEEYETVGKPGSFPDLS
ncbi:LAME_0D08350g1_1 [Lachancea meyersii CBS 8951]|uniref:mRNA export factor GLE1 n=1 Tax=Lachancea meyersii CBS 8951 TaxID=1266667 RepID=A0A1G4JAF9_9SACH|nr:LAME_0D08350g1_1 [Lachancea meyersii CBS 8951]